jgi:rhamnose transport system ATP-binding protein
LAQTLLEVKHLTKYFPGIKALDGVHFTVRAGEVHALIGENGAGKSTLVKILTGVYFPTQGDLIYEGAPLVLRNALDAQRVGIAAIHQEASMFPELTVTENIYMGHHLVHPRFGTVDWKRMHAETQKLLDELDLDIDSNTLITNLSVAQRHMVEIAKALSLKAKVVIMDEPTSALSMREVEDLYKIVRRLKQAGKAIIFISHKFDEIFEICDHYTVLRDGKYIGEGSIAEASVDSIVQMMVGRSLDQMYPKRNVPIGPVVLSVRNLSQTGYFSNVSFDLHQGEILGFFGLIGAGRSEVMRTIFGIDRKTGGTITLDGKELEAGSPAAAMRHGLAFVPEDRQGQGVILQMSIARNTTLPQIDAISPFGVLDRKKENKITETYGSKMEIRSAGWHVDVDTLSGGNQQKVVLAKWLATKPRILILDEPTKGIDVATKAAVHEFVSEMASEGLAVILISSELPEILGMADRILVMHEGILEAEFSREEADADKVIRAATGNVTTGGAA